MIPAPPQLFAAGVAALILARWLAQSWLERLNQRHVRAHADAVPEAFRETVDAATYAKSVAYTLARSRLRQVEVCCDAVVLLLALFSGVLPWGFSTVLDAFGHSVWATAGFLFLTGAALALPGLPFDWYDQFHIEERFGFNTMTPRLWLLDRVKALLISTALGYPLLVLVLKVVAWAGAGWWLWAWSCLTAFQLLMFVLAPVLILPLFNKFTPLPEGPLRTRLLALAERTRFRARSIQVMDGSKRSRHSNAFFTGFGRGRKIVLFDTLIEQLSEAELESVLAHEIGHWRKRHILKMLLGSAGGSLGGFFILGVLADRPWFCGAFGFAPGAIAPALLLFGLLAGSITFWLSPLLHGWSRRFEYEADAFAAGVMASADPLITALRRLNEKNLSNLTPHPFYSGFYYSHPTLLERERALRRLAPPGVNAPLR